MLSTKKTAPLPIKEDEAGQIKRFPALKTGITPLSGVPAPEYFSVSGPGTAAYTLIQQTLLTSTEWIQAETKSGGQMTTFPADAAAGVLLSCLFSSFYDSFKCAHNTRIQIVVFVARVRTCLRLLAPSLIPLWTIKQTP